MYQPPPSICDRILRCNGGVSTALSELSGLFTIKLFVAVAPMIATDAEGAVVRATDLITAYVADIARLEATCKTESAKCSFVEFRSGSHIFAEAPMIVARESIKHFPPESPFAQNVPDLDGLYDTALEALATECQSADCKSIAESQAK